jgi:hypothetical protein
VSGVESTSMEVDMSDSAMKGFWREFRRGFLEK